MHQTIRTLCGVAVATLLASHAQGAIILDYQFEEGSGTTTADSAAPAQNGSFREGLAAGAGPTFVSPGLNGSSYALDFDGTNDNVLVGSNIDLLNGAPGATIAAVIKIDAFNSGSYGNILFVSRNAIASSRAALQVGNDAGGNSSSGRLRIGGRSADGDSFQSYNSGTPSLNTTDTYFVAGVLDYANDQARLYIQNLTSGGPLQEFTSGTLNFSASTASSTNSTSVTIGVRENTTVVDELFNGRIDDVKLYNEILSASQVAALVPEPASIGLLAVTALGLLGRRRITRAC